MERVVILGCSGTGKSTLASRMGERLGLPVVHLDALFWEPGWTEPEGAAFKARVAEALAGGRWISEGGYISRTFDLRLPQADLIVLLDRPLWLRLWRVAWRTLRYWGRTRPDMGPGCREKLDMAFLTYIWNYDRRSRPRVEAEIARYPVTPVARLGSDRDVADFLRNCNAGTAAEAVAPRCSA